MLDDNLACVGPWGLSLALKKSIDSSFLGELRLLTLRLCWPCNLPEPWFELGLLTDHTYGDRVGGWKRGSIGDSGLSRGYHFFFIDYESWHGP